MGHIDVKPGLPKVISDEFIFNPLTKFWIRNSLTCKLGKSDYPCIVTYSINQTDKKSY